MSEFYQLALTEAILLGLLSAITGTVVVLRRRAFFTVALTHAAFPGGVIAALLGINVVLGAGVFSIVLVIALALLSRVPRQGKQVATGVVLTGGFALGMVLQSLLPAQANSVDTFLVGSILTVSRTDVIATAAVLAAAIVVVAGWGKQLVFSSFDPSGYRAAGFAAFGIDLLALGLIAGTVAVAMPAVGSILAVAIIVGPAATARLLTGRIALLMPLAAVIGVMSAVGGLEISRHWNVAAGGAITLLAAAIFTVVAVATALRPRGRTAAA